MTDQSELPATPDTNYVLSIGEAGIESSNLDDATYMEASCAFGAQYQELLTSGAADGELATSVRSALEPYLKPLEGLTDTEIAAAMVSGYRSAYNQLLRNHGVAEEYDSVEPTADELTHVTAVSRSAVGIPILHTDNNRALFKHDTAASFSSPALLMEAGMPPLVVVNDKVKDKDQVAVHETSHAVWSVMEQAGIIPEPAEGRRPIGERSPLDTARDEAAAMQVAGQHKIIHPNVISRLRADNADPALIERYIVSVHAYADAIHNVQGINEADAVLGFMTARSWDEYFTHVDRLTRLSEAAPHVNPVAEMAVQASTTGWGTV